jgi:hypothetical protein
MADQADIAKLYYEFEEALTDVLTQDAHSMAHRTRLFESRMRVKSHRDFNIVEYALAAAEAKRAEAERKAIADAQKIVAIWNARQAGGRALWFYPTIGAAIAAGVP